MILANKKQLDENNPIGAFITKKIREYEEMNQILEFESYLARQPKRRLENGSIEKSQGYHFGSRAQYIIPGVGPVTIDYVVGFPETGEDGKYLIKKTLLHCYERMKINTALEPDKAFFVMEVASATKTGDIRLVDRAGDDKKELAKTADESMVKFMISHESSPLSVQMTGSEDKLRTLAASWNVANSGTIPLPTLQKQLINAVLLSEKNKEKTQRGFDAFHKDIIELQKGNDGEMKIRKDIQTAIDNGKLKHDTNKIILFPGTGAEMELFRHRPTDADRWIDLTVERFMNNQPALKLLREELYFVEDLSDEEKYQNKELATEGTKLKLIKETKNYMKMKSFCSEAKLSTEGNVEDMRERLIKHYTT